MLCFRFLGDKGGYIFLLNRVYPLRVFESFVLFVVRQENEVILHSGAREFLYLCGGVRFANPEPRPYLSNMNPTQGSGNMRGTRLKFSST